MDAQRSAASRCLFVCFSSQVAPGSRIPMEIERWGLVRTECVAQDAGCTMVVVVVRTREAGNAWAKYDLTNTKQPPRRTGRSYTNQVKLSVGLFCGGSQFLYHASCIMYLDQMAACIPTLAMDTTTSIRHSTQGQRSMHSAIETVRVRGVSSKAQRQTESWP